VFKLLLECKYESRTPSQSINNNIILTSHHLKFIAKKLFFCYSVLKFLIQLFGVFIMKKFLLGLWILALLTVSLAAFAGGTTGSPKLPPLDDTQMAFKEQGVWYFLCTAPVFCDRIPPHYLTYGPPPAQCPPPPCFPAMPAKRKR
jgi:hypothetical protein